MLKIKLLLIPQRYEFSSKSQQGKTALITRDGCCWYHKGTNFQANHNNIPSYVTKIGLLLIPQRYEFSSKSQQLNGRKKKMKGCCWYHKGTNFQANHNLSMVWLILHLVVADTTKVRIFKQITTAAANSSIKPKLLLIPQRYEFSSKSQQTNFDKNLFISCCWYHKGTNFQANHNRWRRARQRTLVVADTTKVRIFKQITTSAIKGEQLHSCCWYHKGTNFQANHNFVDSLADCWYVVADTTKVRIFKQITTNFRN